MERTLPGLNMTTQQLFWTLMAQNWCELPREPAKTDDHLPWHMRINYMMMNTADFGRDFQCPVGSLMNPEEKCSVW